MSLRDDSRLADRLAGGERRALAQAVTLIESTRSDHRLAAERLIDSVLARTGRSVRLGISGPPGAGKSTFIETFGLAGIAQGRKPAILAIDPSSKRGGGAILGDKTRMTELSRAPDAYIRPSSAAGQRGGVARRTRETILLCEAAGFDAIVVETVGVGQSETDVADMVDMFLLLLPPAGGDELQGVKRGIVELADLVLVNKADGALADAAQQTVAEYRSALRLLRPAIEGWSVPVLPVSALTGRGIEEVWLEVDRFHAHLQPDGRWQARRSAQARAALVGEIGEGLLDRFREAPAMRSAFDRAERQVLAGKEAPTVAARRLLDEFLAHRS